MAKFEENLTALETVVERLERGDLSLEDSVKLFEQGIVLSGACKAELDAADGRIQVLLNRGSGSGSAVDLPMDEDPTQDEEEAE